MANSRVAISVILLSILFLIWISSTELAHTIRPAEAAAVLQAPPRPLLTASLFFDGSGDPRFVNATFGEPRIDSQGRLLVASSHFSTSCSGPCGARLNSIGSDGGLNWQTPNDNSFITNDLLFSGVPVTIGPGDRVYVQGKTTIYAFDSAGAGITGWPVDVIPPNSPGPSRFSAYAGNSGLTIDSDGTLYAKTGVFSSFNGFPTTVVALYPDGTLKWRKDYDEGGLDWGLIQGPAGNIFTIESSGAGQRLVGIDRVLGTEYCQYSTDGFLNPLLAYSNSLVGGSAGVFTSFRSNIRGFDENCNSGIIFSSSSPEVFLYAFVDDKAFGYTYPSGSLDLSQLRITAISNSGSFLWRNETILPQRDPIHSARNGTLYVLGQDTTDANKPKLFLLDDSTGTILSSLETSSLCGSCGVVATNDGTIYVNDLGSTRIYKINSSNSDQCLASPDGLVSWWPGETNANDIASQNNGTLEGGISFTDGIVGQGFSFDGQDSFISIGNPSNLQTTSAITVDAWVKPTDLAEGQEATVLSKWGQSAALDSYTIFLRKQNGNISLVGAIGVANVSDQGFSGGNITANVWSHVAMTYDANTGSNVLYINGQPVATRTWQGGIFVSDVNVLIGREDSVKPRPFSGAIDEIDIFNRALSDSEIESIFNATSAGKCSPTPNPSPSPTSSPSPSPSPMPTPTPTPSPTPLPCIVTDKAAADEVTRLIPDENDTLPLGNRTPLILIHGIHGNKFPRGTDDIAHLYRDYFKALLSYLNKEPIKSAYKIYRFHYVSDRFSVFDIARALRNDIDAQICADPSFDKPFTIIAHSMGGLVARSYMNEYIENVGFYHGFEPGVRIINLITLATPHHGTPGAGAESRDQLATFGWGHVLDLASFAFWGFRLPDGQLVPTVPFTAPNRSDLLWDNFDRIVPSDNTDENQWLANLNNGELYSHHIIAYYGFLRLDDNGRQNAVKHYNADGNVVRFDRMLSDAYLADRNDDDHSKALIANIVMDYGMHRFFSLNDGLVPVESGSFRNGPVGARIACPGFDHLDMKEASQRKCGDGLTLFESIKRSLGL